MTTRVEAALRLAEATIVLTDFRCLHSHDGDLCADCSEAYDAAGDAYEAALAAYRASKDVPAEPCNWPLDYCKCVETVACKRVAAERAPAEPSDRYTLGFDVTDGVEHFVVMRRDDAGCFHALAEGKWPCETVKPPPLFGKSPAEPDVEGLLRETMSDAVREFLVLDEKWALGETQGVPWLLDRGHLVAELEDTARQDLAAAARWQAELADWCERHQALQRSEDVVTRATWAAAERAVAILDRVLGAAATRGI